MRKTKIGVLDREEEYVMNLTAYLQRYGKGKWDLSAFTDDKALMSFLEKRTLDILVGTDRRSLGMQGKRGDVTRLLLTDKKGDFCKEEENQYAVYRFQSAEEIAKCIESIVRQQLRGLQAFKPMVAVYSPVGRCGKTSLALEVVKCGRYGKWFYFGMEDYSSFANASDKQERIADEVLYYWKEHKEDKILSLLEQMEQVLTTGTSFFDAKQMQQEDWKWFKDVFHRSEYSGVIFDIGSGVLQSFHIFEEFDSILVPYLEEERAQIKRKNFLELFVLQGMEDCQEKIHFVNMDRETEVEAVLEKVLGGAI